MHHHYASPALQVAKQLTLVQESLSTKEQLYVQSRLQGSPPVAAARCAGYEDPGAAAHALERDERIRAYVEYSVKQQAYHLQITRQDVLAGFMDAVHMAATASEMVQAWREIGKLVGAYEPTKVDLTVHKTEDLRGKTDQELAEMAALDGDYTVLDFEDTPQQEALPDGRLYSGADPDD